MAKRFTATEKWLDPWFTSLNSKDRGFWLYLLDVCDHAGIWQVNWPLAKFYHGSDFEFNEAAFKERIVRLSDEKWFIPKFVQFQYGELKEDNRAHASVIQLLKKAGAYKHLVSPIQGAKDMDKDKDQVKDKDKGRFTPPSVEEVQAYCRDRKNSVDAQAFVDHYEARGWIPKGYSQQMKSWKAAVRTWEGNNFGHGGKNGPERTNSNLVARS